MAMLSNGAARAVDPYGLVTWPELVALLGTHGPEEALRRLRAAEAALPTGGTTPDAASAAYCAPEADLDEDARAT